MTVDRNGTYDTTEDAVDRARVISKKSKRDTGDAIAFTGQYSDRHCHEGNEYEK
jgi:hypothetical protein